MKNLETDVNIYKTVTNSKGRGCLKEVEGKKDYSVKCAG